jgi:hypothetical protein
MKPTLDGYQRTIMERICGVCVDRNADGSCGLDPRLACQVEQHLPELLKLVSGVTSDRIGDYVERVRRNVCTICDQGNADACEVRSQVDCALDRYLVLVVEAIEEVERRTAADALASAP